MVALSLSLGLGFEAGLVWLRVSGFWIEVGVLLALAGVEETEVVEVLETGTLVSLAFIFF